MGKVLVLNSETLEFTEVNFDGKVVGYKFIQEQVGGNFEHVTNWNRTLDKNRISMWVDDEYRCKDENWKDNSSIALMDVNLFSATVKDVIAGTVVFLKDGSDGESYGLSETEMIVVKGILNRRVDMQYYQNAEAKANKRISSKQVRFMSYV